MTVYLVGAGPGDPGLITVRGLELVRSCDALIHDRLVSLELVAEALPDAIRIGRKRLDQTEIVELLVRLGRRELEVVRLKGGDPFVFGRGGEEALALAAAGVPFEVVPGVTSLSAVPAAWSSHHLLRSPTPPARSTSQPSSSSATSWRSPIGSRPRAGRSGRQP